MAYTPDPRGLPQVRGLGAACLAAAQTIAATASRFDPRGSYAASPARVPAGWNNALRDGARVRETVRGDGAEVMALVRAVNDPTGYTTKDGRKRLATRKQAENWSRGRR